MITTSLLTDVANTLRGLSIDAVEAAQSGHPGLPLGCAEIGAVLFGSFLRYDPTQPAWLNRDRFVLSAGHGSAFLYACLYLAGYGLSLDDLKAFRQLDSQTPGHPEYGHTAGVETTTGPLGQGLATGIGMALAHRMLRDRLGAPSVLLDGQVVILVGDGCLLEGVSHEASALAGHWQLDNVIVLYDSNDICLDGPVSECSSEDVAKRYEAYGWMVKTIDGHSLSDIEAVLNDARAATKPVLLIAKTVIGKGAPTVAGTSEAHGKALGVEEAAATKAALGLPAEVSFHVSKEVRDFFKQRVQMGRELAVSWQATFDAWLDEDVSRRTLFGSFSAEVPDVSTVSIPQKAQATRSSSSAVLQVLRDQYPCLVGGSADLSCSDNTMMSGGGIVNSYDFSGRNIKYGAREFGMAAIASGIALHGVFQPYCGTFLMFSDYMRNAIRLACLMRIPVVYQFTHDSVLLGEDGPTHQPVEHLASLRAMPGLTVVRPADMREVIGAWQLALSNEGPTALILSRQNLPQLTGTCSDAVAKGGYVVYSEEGVHEITILATGSEVSLAR